MARDNGDNDAPAPGNGTGATTGAPPPVTAGAAEAAPGAEAPQAAAPADPLAEALARIEAVEKEKLELRDRMLRVAADFDNFKKRNRKDLAEAADRGREALLKELLGVGDNLERAVAHAAAADAAAPGTGLVEGVRMVVRQFLAALEKFDVRPFTALGESFDPQFHAAVQQVATADKPAGMVVEEFQRGYKMGARLLRPAMVAVACPPRAAEGTGGGEPAGDGSTAAPSGDAAPSGTTS